MTAASDALGDRLRPLLAKNSVVEKKMFGGLVFMFRGNMLIGTTSKGALLVRVGPDRTDDARTRPGAYRMHMGERVMVGYIAVDPEALPDDAALNGWIDYAMTYAKTLPPK